MKSAQIELPAAAGICCVSCWFYYREQRARGKGRPADIVFSFPAACGSTNIDWAASCYTTETVFGREDASRRAEGGEHKWTLMLQFGYNEHVTYVNCLQSLSPVGYSCSTFSTKMWGSRRCKRREGSKRKERKEEVKETMKGKGKVNEEKMEGRRRRMENE